MKRPVLFLLVLLLVGAFSAEQASAQLWKMRKLETTVGLGPSFFFGDIGGFSRKENVLGFKDLTFLQTRYVINGSLKYRVLEDLNVRLSLSAARLRATDARGSNEGRDMEARTFIFEPALMGEFYFIKNKNENSYLFSKGQAGFRRLINSLDVYAFSGFGGASYSVKGNDRLENVGIIESGFSPIIPVGVGANLIFSPDINLGLELAGRYSFTDYLDGYTSQYSSSNDVYYFLTFTLTYKMKTNQKGWPVFFGSRAGFN